MIQFNLLPDVKLEFIRARRIKRLMTLASMLLIAVSLAVFVVLIAYVHGVQKKSLGDLNSDISKYSTQLKNVKDLDKILTVQNQLSTLTGLHDDKPVAARLFPYLTQLTPQKAALSELKVDFTANTMEITGEAPALDVVNTYTDTLKATKFTIKGSDDSQKAFSDVVLANFGRDDKGATFTITLTFKPDIFDNANTVTLSVPTGASVDPAALFQEVR